ncbi:A subunit of glutamyl-tRNA amidotransferase [Phlyctochytrium arcticum]|nr:A subunit of glutamyl-tRNA amidotransferase [Phlyctochytrium arcticum]
MLLKIPKRVLSPRHITHYSTIPQIHHDIKSGKTSVAAVLGKCFDAMDAKNQELNAVVCVGDREALETGARRADMRYTEGKEKSPIDGLPITIKLSISTTTLPTTCSSRLLQHYASPFDATVVKKLRAAGALIIGKTNMDEFGMGSHNVHSVHGGVKNVFRKDGGETMSPGGSSGGAAVAVASEMCFAALGSDTGGSIRTPAAYTGTVGFKPSYGRLSRLGLVAYASSLDTVGVLARTVGDVAAVYDVVAGHDEMDMTSAPDNLFASPPQGPLSSIRVGIPQEYHIEGLSPGCLQAWHTAAERLASQGATLVPVSLPHTALALSAYYTIAPAEASSNLAKFDGRRFGDDLGVKGLSEYRTRGFGDEVHKRIMLGTAVLQAGTYDEYMLKAQQCRRLIQQDFDAVFAAVNPLTGTHVPEASPRVDVLLTPASLSEAPTQSQLNTLTDAQECAGDVLTVPASLAGLPCVVVPVGSGSGGLPVGVQVVGQWGSDGGVLQAAAALEGLLRRS